MATDNPDLEYETRVGTYIISYKTRDLSPEITEFVAQTYYYQAGFTFTITYAELLRQMLDEDRLVQDHAAVITVYNSEREILGTVRLVFFQDEREFPIQREFGVDLPQVLSAKGPVSDIIEVGRLATKRNSARILKLLFMKGLGKRRKDDLLLAAIDHQLLGDMNRLGFNWGEIGKPRHYRGSLTHPVAQSVREIRGIFSVNEIRTPSQSH
ncbi:MAG: hypothetical protein PHN75_08645 [Syntrophales bacterium]|nr:hypothetical protein [Syntrophales bacterium]